MRLAMTVGTLRNVAVLVLVAGDTGQRPVFAGISQQFDEYLCMAGTTGARGHIFGKGDLPRLMNRMALEAGWQFLPLKMRLVTGEAGWFETVRCVARGTGNFCVLARVCDKLVTDGTVTVETGGYKLGRCSDLPWSMRIGVACVAFGDLRPVWCVMAGGTCGHDGVPIPLARVIGMEKVMTVLAGEAVPATIVFKVLELTGVALGALSRCERLRFRCILLRGCGYRNLRNLFSLCRCK